MLAAIAEQLSRGEEDLLCRLALIGAIVPLDQVGIDHRLDCERTAFKTVSKHERVSEEVGGRAAQERVYGQVESSRFTPEAGVSLVEFVENVYFPRIAERLAASTVTFGGPHPVHAHLLANAGWVRAGRHGCDCPNRGRISLVCISFPRDLQIRWCSLCSLASACWP